MHELQAVETTVAAVIVPVEAAIVVPVVAGCSVGWRVRKENVAPRRSGGEQEIARKRRARSDGRNGVLDVAAPSERPPSGKKREAKVGENQKDLGTCARVDAAFQHYSKKYFARRNKKKNFVYPRAKEGLLAK